MITRDELKEVVGATRRAWNSGTPGVTRDDVKRDISQHYDVPEELVELVLRGCTGHKSLKLF